MTLVKRGLPGLQPAMIHQAITKLAWAEASRMSVARHILNINVDEKMSIGIAVLAWFSLLSGFTHAAQPSAPQPIIAPLRDLQWGQLNFLHSTDIHGWHAGHLQEYVNCSAVICSLLTNHIGHFTQPIGEIIFHSRNALGRSPTRKA